MRNPLARPERGSVSRPMRTMTFILGGLAIYLLLIVLPERLGEQQLIRPAAALSVMVSLAAVVSSYRRAKFKNDDSSNSHGFIMIALAVATFFMMIGWVVQLFIFHLFVLETVQFASFLLLAGVIYLTERRPSLEVKMPSRGRAAKPATSPMTSMPKMSGDQPARPAQPRPSPATESPHGATVAAASLNGHGGPDAFAFLDSID